MSWAEKNDVQRNQLREMRKLIPDAFKGFGALSKGADGEGALDHKTKELLALGMAIAVRCEPCISLHVEALIKAGATRDEVASVLAMAIQMGGGPAMMYAAKTLEAFDELSQA